MNLDPSSPNKPWWKPRSSLLPSQPTALARLLAFIPSLGNKVAWHIIACLTLTILVLGVCFGITSNLILGDVDDRIPLLNGPEQQIGLIANFLDIDATMRTVTVDWFPIPNDCRSEELVVNLFVDPNLLTADPNGTASADPPTDPIFRLNTTKHCHPTNHNSFGTFRTSLKLTGRGNTARANSRSLQAYPFDLYFFQVSMFAQLDSTNTSVGISLGKSFGIPINFDVVLDKTTSSDNADGILLNFTVSRSMAVKALVVIIVIANWLVTIAFLWVTVAAFIWEHEIVTEMFVVPIATLFAFTSVRANLPGAPAGFGAVVDYYGILPNLGLMTLFSAILLLGVLYRRVSQVSKPMKCSCMECKCMKCNCLSRDDVETATGGLPQGKSSALNQVTGENNAGLGTESHDGSAEPQELLARRPSAARATTSLTVVPNATVNAGDSQ